MRFRAVSAVVCSLLLTISAVPSSAEERPFEVPTTNPRTTLVQRVAATEFELSYQRPRVKGREIFGALVPWGEVWRTGADSATRIAFDTPIEMEGQRIPAGEYELFTIPDPAEWTVIIHQRQNQWGAYSYDPANDVARLRVRPIRLSEPVESFRIGFDRVGNSTAVLQIDWDRTRVPVRIAIDVEETVVPELERMLIEAERKPYFLAAMFYYENGLDIDRAAELIGLAVEAAPDHIGILHRQALILAEQGDVDGAIAAAKRSLDGAESAPPPLRDEYVRLNTALLERLEGPASD